jgi:hypothetical protein
MPAAVVKREQLVRAINTGDTELSGSYTTPTAGVAAKANTYTLSSKADIQTARFRLTGSAGYLLPQSVRLYYTLTNSSSTALTPLTGPWGVWGAAKLSVMGGSVALESVEQYGRHHTAFGWNMLSRDEQFEEAAHGWNGALGLFFADGQSPQPQSIPATSGKAKVSHLLHFSIFQQRKLLTLMRSDVQLELTLNPLLIDYMTAPAADGTITFKITDLYVAYDVCTIDTNLPTASPKVYPLFYYGQQNSTVTIAANQKSFSLTLSQKFSRICCVWVSFYSSTEPAAFAFINPVAADGGALIARLKIGNESVPSTAPANTTSQLFMLLEDAYNRKPPNIDGTSFAKTTSTDANRSNFTLAWELCASRKDPLSSLSTLNGDDLIFEFENVKSSVTIGVTVTVVAVGALTISDTSSVLLLA